MRQLARIRREAVRHARLGRGAFGSALDRSPAVDIDRFVLIAGHSRSGSTLLASLLDAHPDIAIAFEAEILRAAANGRSRSTLVHRAQWHSRAFRRRQFRWEGYDYCFGDLQGRPEGCTVLGDKSAGRSADLLASNASALLQLHETLGAPVVVVDMERNPLDVIASMLTRNPGVMTESEATDRHRRRVEGLSGAEVGAGITSAIVHHADLCADPESTIAGVLDALGLEPTDEYLDLCRSAADPELSEPSLQRTWQADTIDQVLALCGRHDRLARYAQQVARCAP